MMLRSGQRVAGRFTITRFIAEGGMGEVYEARDEILGEDIALKFLSQRSLADEQMERRFRREIQLARKVTHPNVCRLYDVYQHTVPVGMGETLDVTFVTMELLRGPTLEEHLDETGPLQEIEALPLVEQMCAALSAAHAVGIVHRDFKSNNVMLVPGESGTRAVVTDFGLARSVYPNESSSRTPLTVDQLIVGTADYMAPEQIHGEPVSPASDLYALGVVLFEMLTGAKPYTAANPMQLLVKRINEPPKRPRSLRPSLSTLWEDVILHCLESRPEDRPESALAVLAELGVPTADSWVGRSSGSGSLPVPPSGTMVTDPHEGSTIATSISRLQAARPGTTGRSESGAPSGPAPSGPAPSGPAPAGPAPSGPEPSGPAPSDPVLSDPALSAHLTDPSTTVTAGDDARRLWGRALPWALGIAALIALGIVVLATRLDRRDDPAEELARSFSPLRITTSPRLEIDPTFSPDGRSLAYAADDEDGSFRITVVDLDDPAGRTTFDAGDGRAFQPDFAPDGRSLVFHSEVLGGLWRAPLDGGPPTRLLDRGSHPAHSPDGAFIAFQTGSSPLLSESTSPAMPPSTLAILELATGRVEDLTLPGQPAGGHGAPTWTPDGRWVVFSSSWRAESEIWAIEVATGTLRPLIRKRGSGWDPVVTGDGRHVIFTSRAREVRSLWQIGVDPRTLEVSSPPREIAGLGLSSIRQPALSSRGDLAYSAFVTNSELYALPLDGLEPAPPARALTSIEGRNNRPAIAPDGRRVAFDHWRLGIQIRLVLLDLATGLRRSPTYGASSQASWLPDGRISYTRLFDDDRRELRAIDPDSGQDDVIEELEPTMDWIVVSPGGRYVAFHARADGPSPDIFLRDLATGVDRRVTRHEAAASFPCWSPDSRHLSYQVREGDSSELWITHIDGTARRLVAEAGHSWPYSFSPDGAQIAFAAERGGRWSLRWVDVDTGRQGELLPPVPGSGYVRYPTWSPTGDLLVYEASESASDLFVVDRFF